MDLIHRCVGAVVGLALVVGVATAQTATVAPLPECEWCGAAEAPEDVGWQTTIAGPDEPGERLVLEGTVYATDGVTPADGVLLYVYHTNAEGRYEPRGEAPGNERRHGALRGWVRTDERGRYRVETIKPAPYPGRSEPAHIHLTVTPPGGDEDWVDSVKFAGDPLLDDRDRDPRNARGGSGVVTLERDADGVLHAVRDIVLPS
jgi:protocatechuate 3,4-dioxygenase beta subunit